MGTKIIDWFGFPVSDRSAAAQNARMSQTCPFMNASCIKSFIDGGLSGVCTLKQATREPVVCCPNRLYGDNWLALNDVVELAFGPGLPLVPGGAAPGQARRH